MHHMLGSNFVVIVHLIVGNKFSDKV